MKMTVQSPSRDTIERVRPLYERVPTRAEDGSLYSDCLLYTSDAADE